MSQFNPYQENQMTLDEAIKYAETSIPEPDIAKYLKAYKECLEARIVELDSQMNKVRNEILLANLTAPLIGEV